jgi:hypothetical protein
MGAMSESNEQQKTAGALVYLIEELGDARMRCDQLLRYVDKATKLIEKSAQKDHLFEVAGDLIHGIPETSFKLHKALQAVALAANRIDYEEIKQDLRPEKTEELERVLKDVRIRQVQRRSTPMLNPEGVVGQLRGLAKKARQDGILPVADLGSLIQSLEAGSPKVAQDTGAKIAAEFEAMAQALENPPKGELPSRVRLAGLLRRTLAEHMDLSATVDASTETMKAATIDAQPRDPEVLDGLLAQLLTDARLASNFGKSGNYKKMFFNLMKVLADVQVLTNQFDIQGTGFLQRVIKALMPYAGARPSTNFASSEVAADEIYLRTAESEALKGGLFKSLEEEVTYELTTAISAIKKAVQGLSNPRRTRTMFMSALACLGRASNALGQDPVIAEALERASGILFRKWTTIKLLDDEGAPADMGTVWASDDEKRSRFEEGKPADPTKKMSPEDAKEWKANTEEHKDNFKKDAAKPPEDVVIEITAAIESLKKLSRGAGNPKRLMIGILSGLSLTMKKMGQDEMISNLLDRAASTVQAKWSAKDLKEAEETDKSEIEKTAFVSPEPQNPEEVTRVLAQIMDAARKATNLDGDYKRVLFQAVRMVNGLYGLGMQFEVPSIGLLVRIQKELMKFAGVHPTTTYASEDEKRSRFEEGKPADPTKKMSPEDAKEWKENTEEHKDKFKAGTARVAVSMSADQWYVQKLSSGDIYFLAKTQQKNGGWAGVMVKPEDRMKAKKSSVTTMDSRLWKEARESDVPDKVKNWAQARMASADDALSWKAA